MKYPVNGKELELFMTFQFSTLTSHILYTYIYNEYVLTQEMVLRIYLLSEFHIMLAIFVIMDEVQVQFLVV